MKTLYKEREAATLNEAGVFYCFVSSPMEYPPNGMKPFEYEWSSHFKDKETHSGKNIVYCNNYNEFCRLLAHWNRIPEWRYSKSSGMMPGNALPEKKGVQHINMVKDESTGQIGAEVDPVIYDGKKSGYKLRAEFAGDPGIYNELRVGVFDKKDGTCVADTFFTVTPEGEPRIDITAGGDGEGDHEIEIFPMRPKNEAVNLDKTGVHSAFSPGGPA